MLTFGVPIVVNLRNDHCRGRWVSIRRHVGNEIRWPVGDRSRQRQRRPAPYDRSRRTPVGDGIQRRSGSACNGCQQRPPDANDKRIRAGNELRRRSPGDEYLAPVLVIFTSHSVFGMLLDVTWPQVMPRCGCIRHALEPHLLSQSKQQLPAVARPTRQHTR